MTNSVAPAVSVIVPLYNAEKYVADCLDSLLSQTFQDFEVIVVNDCSTDNSVAIVESYAEKFGGRLILSHMDKNSGSGALPRNKGLELSRGEYVYFADADDMLTKTALKELYTLAKDYDAEVVYCERYYSADDNLENIKIVKTQPGDCVDKPTFETEDLAQRIQEIINLRFWVTPWGKFTRRDFLFENEIFFPHCKISEDNIWTYALVVLAKRFLRVPNAVYMYRRADTSILRIPRTPQQTINFWLNPILLALETFDKFLSKAPFLKENPQYKYVVLEKFITARFNKILKESFSLSPAVFCETLQKEFGDRLGEYGVLIPMLCTVISTQQKMFAINKQSFKEFAAQAQKRIAELEAQLKTK